MKIRNELLIHYHILFRMLRAPLFVNHKGNTLTLISLLINWTSEALWGQAGREGDRGHFDPGPQGPPNWRMLTF